MSKIPNEALEAVTVSVKPYRLRSMVVTAGKIMDLMVKSDISVSYEEMELILDMVRYAIKKGAHTDDDKRQTASVDR